MPGANKIHSYGNRSLPLDLVASGRSQCLDAACQPARALKLAVVLVTLGQSRRVPIIPSGTRSFLGFLHRRSLLQSEGTPAVNVTTDKVDAYLADLKARVASTTAHDSIATLRLVAQIIAPGGDFHVGSPK